MTSPKDNIDIVSTTSVDDPVGGRPLPRCTRVLLVEDDNALRRYLQVALERAGYKVVSAADGLEGMKLALSSEVDVVITDAMMPNLSGHEFCRFLRNSPQLSHIPIVLLSGSQQKEDELADASLSKPVSVEGLTSCLAELLVEK